MRFLHISLLVLVTTFFLQGCGGKSERGATVSTAAKTRSAASGEAQFNKANIAATPTASYGSKAGDTEMAFAPERDFKLEPPRAIKPDDELRLTPPENPSESKREKQQPRIKAGTLTAGSLNDHKNLEDYREYLSAAQQSPAGRNMPPFNLGERVSIEVKDAQGQGVADVHITLTHLGQSSSQNEGVLLDTTTRADGKTFFCSQLDDGSGAEAYELTVRPPNGKAIIKEVSVAQSPWVVELPDITRQLPQQLDLALVVDTTQSMGDELNYLKVELDNIVSSVHRMFPNVEQRYSLIVYRDEGDDYVVRNVIDFTSSLPDFRAKLAQQSAKGGGDIPEAMHSALENANKLSWRHENTARVMFLVADAPPHHPHVERTIAAVNNLRQRGVAVYPLAGSGVLAECEFLMRATAFLTRGQYLFLTDHSGVGNAHAKPTAPKYEVEPLNQLMIRMIASELSGKEVLAQEIIATEESDGSEPPPLPQEQNQSATDDMGEDLHIAHTHLPSHAAHSIHTSYAEPKNHAVSINLWELTWFRIVVAIAVIGGILLIDQKMRT